MRVTTQTQLTARDKDGVSTTLLKGHPLQQQMTVLRELAGPARFNAILQRLSPAHRDMQAKGYLSSGWYPVGWLGEAYAAASPLIPEIPDLPERVSRLGVERDMKGLYKFLTKLISPRFLAKQTPRILATYYKGPSIHQLLEEPQHYRFRLENCRGFDRNLWRDLAGGTGRLFEEVGARNVNVGYAKGGGNRDTTSILDVRWE